MSTATQPPELPDPTYLGSVPPSPYPANLLMDQYKAYIADVGNIGTRHTQTNTWYVSILSALLVVVTLTGSTSALGGIANPIRAAVGVLGILLCLSWRYHGRSFGELYRVKFDVLRQMELWLPFRCYKLEVDLLKESQYFHLTRIEGWITLALAIPFLILLAYAIVMTLA
jgi:hypothetical protein